VWVNHVIIHKNIAQYYQNKKVRNMKLIYYLISKRFLGMYIDNCVAALKKSAISASSTVSKEP